MTARVSSSLQIISGNLNYRSNPTSFSPTVTGANGPTPGAVTIPLTGSDIVLSQLVAMGGLCRLMNLDKTNYVTVGIRDTVANKFYPLMELLPGETYVMRLSRKIPMTEAGTGTFSGASEALHAKANVASAILLVEAFDP